jgi:AraC-like DNA-binding protein
MTASTGGAHYKSIQVQSVGDSRRNLESHDFSGHIEAAGKTRNPATGGFFGKTATGNAGSRAVSLPPLLANSVDAVRPETAEQIRRGLSHCTTCGQPVLPGEARESIERLALSQLAVDLEGCSPDCWQFFEALFSAPAGASAKTFSASLGVLPSSLMSRFFRARLPAPKGYIDGVTLIRAARLMENPRFRIVRIAYELNASSSQSFGRWVKRVTGLTAQQFRDVHTGESMIARFRAELVAPHIKKLRALRPLLVREGAP